MKFEPKLLHESKNIVNSLFPEVSNGFWMFRDCGILFLLSISLHHNIKMTVTSNHVDDINPLKGP